MKRQVLLSMSNNNNNNNGISSATILLSAWRCKGYNIGIKHGFSCINICQVPREVLKTETGGRGFQHLPGDLANVNALKNYARSL